MTASPSRWIPTSRRVLLLLVAVGILPIGYAWALPSGAREDGESPPSRPDSASAGEVDFDHEMHFSDFEIPCEECHHETNANPLETPHPQYLASSSVDCLGCHREAAGASPAQHCAECHPEAPADTADQTLSSKVVIHQVCWRCHEVGLGEAASRGCGSCHQKHQQIGRKDLEGESRGGAR